MRIRRDEQGQAVVELALVLPVVVMFVLAALQVAVVARDQLAIEFVAREAARAAAVSADPRGAALRRGTPGHIAVADRRVGQCRRRRWCESASATSTSPTSPSSGAAIGDVTLQATAAMAWEPP